MGESLSSSAKYDADDMLIKPKPIFLKMVVPLTGIFVKSF